MKAEILQTLDRFIRQRPGLEYGNYGNPTSYRAEMRDITRDLHHARELLATVSWRDSITADDLMRAAKESYSGRLSIVTEGEKVSIDYCTGQYFPTEYRKAVCAVLSSALWDYWRKNGGKPRETAKRELSRSVARRWFN